MKQSWTKTVLPLAGVAIMFLVSAVPANAAVIASTDFDGRTLTTTNVANDTATNLNWSLNGVDDPGDMAAKNAGGGGQVIFNNTTTVQNIFAPGINTGNGNTFWTTDVSITPATGVDVTLTGVTFNYWAISGSQVENVNRRSDFTATLFNPSAGQVDSVTVADVLGGTGAGRPPVALTFAAPIALSEPGTYTLQIKGGDFTGTNETGNHTAIDNLSINGDVSGSPIPGEPGMFSVNLFAYGRARDDEWNQESWRETVRLDPTDTDRTAGVWETEDWQNMGPGQPGGVLLGTEGAVATLTWNNERNASPFHWTSIRDDSDAVDVGNATLMDGHRVGTEYTDPPGPSTVPDRIIDFEVSDIPFDTYDVILYLGINQAQDYNGLGTIKFNGGAEQNFTLIRTEPDGTLAEIVDETTPGNYFLYEGVTGSSFTAQIWGDNFTHLGLAGFQIREAGAAIPEPSAFALAALGLLGLGLVRRRRRK